MVAFVFGGRRRSEIAVSAGAITVEAPIPVNDGPPLLSRYPIRPNQDIGAEQMKSSI